MLPEVASLNRSSSLIRVPPADNVPISDRVRRVIDSEPMRRLSSISQLGMVALVYPGANHTRLEHSLGVYHNALRLLARFADDPAFTSLVTAREAEAFVFAALVHDVGHWPFCHPIEDMRLPSLGEHEDRISHCISETELQACLDEDWTCDRDDVLRLLCGDPESAEANGATRLLASCLSGPVDIDKLDYLQRDSLHCGVPYGRNFDVARLISATLVNPQTSRLAVGEKGRTAAEMMVFARYVMFSEVYWHHAVRSATAMLQRCVYELQTSIQLTESLDLVDADWTKMLRQAASGTACEHLAEGLFGPRRSLFKRVAEFNIVDGAKTHRLLARRPYEFLVACSNRIVDKLCARTGLSLAPTDLLVDAPPVKLEVDINMDVVGRDGAVRRLGDVSPVASALAVQQFDNHVKRVRVFASHPRRSALADAISRDSWSEVLAETCRELDADGDFSRS